MCIYFFVTSFTIFIIIIMVSRFDCHLVAGLKQSEMQDSRYHTLWSVWESRGFIFWQGDLAARYVEDDN